MKDTYLLSAETKSEVSSFFSDFYNVNKGNISQYCHIGDSSWVNYDFGDFELSLARNGFIGDQNFNVIISTDNSDIQRCFRGLEGA